MPAVMFIFVSDDNSGIFKVKIDFSVSGLVDYKGLQL